MNFFELLPLNIELSASILSPFSFACPVKCLSRGMRSLFLWGEAYFTGELYASNTPPITLTSHCLWELCERIIFLFFNFIELLIYKWTSRFSRFSRIPIHNSYIIESKEPSFYTFKWGRHWKAR